MWGNDANSVEQDPEAQFYADANSVAEVIYSCIQDDVAGDSTVPFSATNIDKDPNFIAPASGNYRPEGGTSPSFAIDAGSNSLLYQFKDARYADLDYVKRIQNGTVDIGCYENGTTEPNAVDTVIMCWIDESSPYHGDSDLTDYSGYDLDLADLQQALAATGEIVRIGVYAPESFTPGESIFPHILGICDFDVLYDYPQGIDIAKGGLGRNLSIEDVNDLAVSDFEELIGDSVPLKVILVRDNSGSLDGLNYIEDGRGISQFETYLSVTYSSLTIENASIPRNSSLTERWLKVIANEINN